MPVNEPPRAPGELTLEIATTLFVAASLRLATTDGPLRDRLFVAYGSGTIDALRFVDQLPGPFATRIVALHAQLTGGVEPGSDGEQVALSETLASMTGDELTDAARRICFLADDLTFMTMRDTPGSTRASWPWST
jgi:hypothetical protein